MSHTAQQVGLHRRRFSVDSSLEDTADLAVMFVDVVNYSGIVGEEGAAAGREIVTTLQRLFEKSLCGEEPAFARSFGDEVLCCFEKPRDAVATAFRLQGLIETENARRKKTRKLRVRIGISYGEVLLERRSVAGHVEDVLGRTINEAKWVETSARPGRVLASESLLNSGRRVGGAHRFFRKAKPKGRDEEIRLFEIISRKHIFRYILRTPAAALACVAIVCLLGVAAFVGAKILSRSEIAAPYRAVLEDTAAALRTDSATKTPRDPAQAPRDAETFTIQAASFKSRKDAESVVATFKESDLDARAVPVKLRNSEIWYQVRVGSFLSQSEAKAMLETGRIREQFPDSFVRRE